MKQKGVLYREHPSFIKRDVHGAGGGTSATSQYECCAASRATGAIFLQPS